MNTNLKNSFSKTLLALAIASATTVSQAGSFGLIEHSASSQGVAHAGAAAIGEDASTIYFNPAAMTRLSGSQIVVGGHIISAEAKFTNKGSTTFAGTPLAGSDNTTDEVGFIPNFYYSTDLGDDVFLGVGVTVPFGLATEYDNGWVGRYHALRSEIMSININPSIAFKATDTVSVGFGLNIQYLALELTSNIDSQAACVNIASGGDPSKVPAAFGTCAGAGLTASGNAATDSNLKLDGDSLEIGWNVGILIDVSPKSRLGIAYRSAIKHEVSGDADYTLNPGLAAVAGGATAASGFNILLDTPLQATAELPETFSVSFVSDVNTKWTLLADWTWTGWSSLDEIVIRQSGGVPGAEPTLELAYANTSRYSVGAHYKPNATWVYRAGVAYDETPIRSAEQTSARIPGNDRTWLSFGLGYAPAATWSLDVAYTHLFISDFDINNKSSTSSGATLVGSYEASVDILSAQVNFNF